ncbi:MAG TPA: glycosyltransferase family 4 protein [Pirellulales bacterium]|jgi:glycosyltransferase involved in cell wall biosynthesis
MVKVLVVGQTPPPYLGQPIMLQKLLDSGIADVELHHVGIRLSTDANEVGRFGWTKVLNLFPIIAHIWWARIFRGVKILYYPPAGPNRVTMFRDFAILLPTRFLFAKTIFHFHASGLSEMYPRLPAWQRWLFRRAYYNADAGIRLSELTPDDARQLRVHREYVIANGIDDPCPAGPITDTTPVSTQRPLRVLFVAMLRESKGVLVLIEAAAQLAQRGVPVEVEIMGQFISPEFADRVHARVKELGVEDRVKFLGMLTGDAKFAAYARADIFSMPTFYESEAFPVVLLEAMAYGLPIVATRWRGIPTIVDDEVTGFLVEPRDSSPVADRIAELAEDPALRVRLGQAGREKFLDLYVWERHLTNMRRVFLDTAGIVDARHDEVTLQQPAPSEAKVEALA